MQVGTIPLLAQVDPTLFREDDMTRVEGAFT